MPKFNVIPASGRSHASQGWPGYRSAAKRATFGLWTGPAAHAKAARHEHLVHDPERELYATSVVAAPCALTRRRL